MMLLPVSALHKSACYLFFYIQSMTDMQTLRGKMWRTFLGLEAVKQEGYYEQLVYQALGNKYSKRKVKVGVCILTNTASKYAIGCLKCAHAKHDLYWWHLQLSCGLLLASLPALC